MSYLLCSYFASALKHFLTTGSRACVRSSGVPLSPSLVKASLLLSLGLHCATHASYLRRRRPLCSDMGTAAPEPLFRTAEASLKLVLTSLEDLAAVDQRLLNEIEPNIEDVAQVRKIAQFETSEEQLIQSRLLINDSLRSLAWHGLAVVYRATNGASVICVLRMIDYV